MNEYSPKKYEDDTIQFQPRLVQRDIQEPNIPLWVAITAISFTVVIAGALVLLAWIELH